MNETFANDTSLNNMLFQDLTYSRRVHVQVLYLQIHCVQFNILTKTNEFNERILLHSLVHNTANCRWPMNCKAIDQ